MKHMEIVAAIVIAGLVAIGALSGGIIFAMVRKHYYKDYMKRKKKP